MEEHHNLNTEQLGVSLDGIKQFFSIATTIDSNDKLSWTRLRRYKTWTVSHFFSSTILWEQLITYTKSQASITVYIPTLYFNQDIELV